MRFHLLFFVLVFSLSSYCWQWIPSTADDSVLDVDWGTLYTGSGNTSSAQWFHLSVSPEALQIVCSLEIPDNDLTSAYFCVWLSQGPFNASSSDRKLCDGAGYSTRARYIFFARGSAMLPNDGRVWDLTAGLVFLADNVTFAFKPVQQGLLWAHENEGDPSQAFHCRSPNCCRYAWSFSTHLHSRPRGLSLYRSPFPPFSPSVPAIPRPAVPDLLLPRDSNDDSAAFPVLLWAGVPYYRLLSPAEMGPSFFFSFAKAPRTPPKVTTLVCLTTCISPPAVPAHAVPAALPVVSLGDVLIEENPEAPSSTSPVPTWPLCVMQCSPFHV